MYPVWLLSLAKLRKKKGQSFIILIIIMLSTLLLSTAIVTMENTTDTYLDLHTKVNGSHEILQLKNNLYDENYIYEFWAKQKGVDVSPTMAYQSLAGIRYKGKDFFNIQAYMVDTPKETLNVDQLIFTNGEVQDYPEEGTIWIPTSIAYNKNIEVGDKIEFDLEAQKLELKVSAIVIDLPYCSPFSNSARIWMNTADYSKYFNSHFDKKYMLALRFDDYSQSRQYWNKFEEYLEAPYLESVKNFESLSAFYMVTNKLIGFVMICLALIMMLIAIFTIGFTISDDIISSYKSIGIVRSLGLISHKIIYSNMTLYGTLSVLGIIPGAIMSYFFSKAIVRNAMSYLRVENGNVDIDFNMVGIGVALFIIATIIISVYVFTHKVRFIKPAQAIRFGTSEKHYGKLARTINQSQKRLLSFEHLPITLVIGLRAIAKTKRSSFFTVLVTSLTAGVLVFGFIFIFSIASIEKNINQWGYDGSDISVVVKEHSKGNYDDIKAVFENDKRIKNYSMHSDINAVVPGQKSLVTGESFNESMSILLSVVDGSYDDIGFTNLEGRNPQKPNEIAIGVNLAKKYGYQIGENFHIYIEGKKRSFIITGIYQAISNMSYTGRVYGEAIRNVNADYNILDVVFINLNEGVSSKSFTEELNSGDRFTALTKEELVDEVFSELSSILLLPMLIMGATFIVSAFVIIYCICKINIKKQSKNFGIYKSVGINTFRIRLFVTLSTFTLSLIGAFIGLVLGIYLLPTILNQVLLNYGIVKMPIIINHIGVLISMSITIIVASLGAWHASKYIKTTSPRILTIE